MCVCVYVAVGARRRAAGAMEAVAPSTYRLLGRGAWQSGMGRPNQAARTVLAIQAEKDDGGLNVSPRYWAGPGAVFVVAGAGRSQSVGVSRQIRRDG